MNHFDNSYVRNVNKNSGNLENGRSFQNQSLLMKAEWSKLYKEGFSWNVEGATLYFWMYAKKRKIM